MKRIRQGIARMLRNDHGEALRKALEDSIDLDALPHIATSPQVAAIMQTTVDALRMTRYRGGGLPYLKVGASVRYLRKDVLDYLAAHRTAA
jgi:hypothetical protein